MKKDKHIFALFFEQAGILQKDTEYSIEDKDVVHRLVHILRIHQGDEFIVFNKTRYASVEAQVIGKKNILIKVHACTSNQINKPQITLLLPLLKKDAFEAALYGVVECGVSKIIPVLTHKVHRNWWSEKEVIRLTKIVHAAAEQSKNFSFPDLCKPVSLHDALHACASEQIKMFFDPAGKAWSDIYSDLFKKESIVLALGPEGDLTVEEKKILHQYNFEFVQLTPTILRAQQAAVLATGIIRSIVR